jgi:hypothetical protein
MEVNPNSTTDPMQMYNYLNKFFMTPMMFTYIVFIVIIFALLSFSLDGQSSNSTNFGTTDGSNSMQTFGTIAIAIVVVLVIVNLIQYYLGYNIYASISHLVYGTPEIDIHLNKITDQGLIIGNNVIGDADAVITAAENAIPEIVNFDQVFNIPGNNYSYGDAKALCKAYGARLATYDEVENSYNSGGEWCNYGWSDGQMALYPTQKNTYENLQKIKGHEHDCGRPGVNGGYIANPLVKFGANCYGYKPRINQEEQELMDVSTPYPKTKKDLAMEQRVAYWKTKLNDILVSPFNYNLWSRI